MYCAELTAEGITSKVGVAPLLVSLASSATSWTALEDRRHNAKGQEAARTAGLEDNQGTPLKVAEAEPKRQNEPQGSFRRLSAL